jgi:hypothetical protein
MAFPPILADAGTNLLAARNQMGSTLVFHIVRRDLCDLSHLASK